MTVLSVGGGAGVRRAAVGAAAGALATRCWRSGTPWELERAPACPPPGDSQLLDGHRSKSGRSPSPRGGRDWPVDTRGADRGCAPRPVRGGARRCVCAKHAVGGAVVLLDGGSSWSAPGRAALLEPPAAASAAAAALCRHLPRSGVGRRPHTPASGRGKLPRVQIKRRGAEPGCGRAREPGRPLWSGAARTGRSREEHHLLAC